MVQTASHAYRLVVFFFTVSNNTDDLGDEDEEAEEADDTMDTTRHDYYIDTTGSPGKGRQQTFCSIQFNVSKMASDFKQFCYSKIVPRIYRSIDPR